MHVTRAWPESAAHQPCAASASSVRVSLLCLHASLDCRLTASQRMRCVGASHSHSSGLLASPEESFWTPRCQQASHALLKDIPVGWGKGKPWK